MNYSFKRTAHIPLVLMVIAASGCGLFRGPAAQQEPIRISFRVTGESNLNGGGNAAFVHIYQLGDNAALRNALPESFWQSPEQVLGDALVGSRQIQLFPGSDETLTVDLSPDARFVGVAANLRAPDRDRWRTILPAEELSGRVVNVMVDSNSLSAEVQ